LFRSYTHSIFRSSQLRNLRHPPVGARDPPGPAWRGFLAREAVLSALESAPPPGAEAGDQPAPGFNEYLLGGVVALTIFTVLLGMAMFLLPGTHLQIPDLQPAVRVADEADFPVGSSRLVTWGHQAILVVRPSPDEYDAVQGTSSADGCLLQWDPESTRILSPCKFVIYDLHGNVVRGLTTVPLHRYPVFVRRGTVYVAGR
jgi:nitrite reductase/ring-hydroxylating ferredoxin subunit